MNPLPLFLCCLTWSICQCAPLQTAVSPMRSGDASCVGDMVTITCSFSAATHRWNISSVPSNIISDLFASDPPRSNPPYTIAVTSMNSSVVTESRLTVTSFPELNGVNILCFSPPRPGIELQETTVMVFDPPSAPELMVTPGNNLEFFIFNIIPPTPPDCVTNYTVNIIGSDDVNVETTVPANGMGNSTSTFDLCGKTYNFTVTALTVGGNGATSGSVSLFPGGNPLISNVRSTTTGIEWDAPSNVPMVCFSQYIVSESDSNIELIVSDTTATFEDLSVANFTFCETISIRVTPMLNGMPVNASSVTSEITLNDDTCPTTQMQTDTTASTTGGGTGGAGGGGSTGGFNATAVGGGVGGGIVGAMIAFVCIIVLVIFCKKKKVCCFATDKDDVKMISTSTKDKEPYHSSGAPPPQTSIPLSDAVSAGAMYASPDEIKHEAAGPTGDEYALVTSNTKKKSRQPAPAADTPDVGDMYSVPDKTKKKENQGLVYADIGHQPAPKKGRVVPQQSDSEPVTYATVAV